MLQEKIEKKKQNLTTLITLYVVLNDYIEVTTAGQRQDGLSMTEITSRYRAVADRYNVKEKFYPSYIQRHIGENDFFSESAGKYIINSLLVMQDDVRDLVRCTGLILGYLEDRRDMLTEFFGELDEMIHDIDIHKAKEYILSLFNEEQFGNFGQVFEVLSYSILKVYFESFGFSLKRFSVSFSNDGGMDYISSNGIYQVTASQSVSKISEDLEKLPGTYRVMVLFNCSDKIMNKCLSSNLVTELITADDLKSHFIEWIYKRDKFRPILLKRIITSIRDEMLRETR